MLGSSTLRSSSRHAGRDSGFRSSLWSSRCRSHASASWLTTMSVLLCRNQPQGIPSFLPLMAAVAPVHESVAFQFQGLHLHAVLGHDEDLHVVAL